ncbi:DUF5962 family protein [Streptococcus thoraltensis]
MKEKKKQLEIICQTSENEFTNLSEELRIDDVELVGEGKRHDTNKADR